MHKCQLMTIMSALLMLACCRVCCRGTCETSLWKTAPALPWVRQPAPALHPIVPANLMGVGKDQGDSARAVSNSLEGRGPYPGPLSDYLAGGHRAVQHTPTGCLTRALPDSPSRHAQFDCPVHEITRFNSDSSRGDSNTQVQSSPGESWPAHNSPNQQIRPAQTHAEREAALQNSSFGFQSQGQAFHEWLLPSPSSPASSPAGANCPKGHTSLFLQTKPDRASASGCQYESPPPAGQLDGRARAVQKSLKCRLAFPHGTRSHKRPRLEDRLKEVTHLTYSYLPAHLPCGLDTVPLCRCTSGVCLAFARAHLPL